MVETVEIFKPFLPALAEVYRLIGYPRAEAASPEAREIIRQEMKEAERLIEPWAGYTVVEVAEAGAEEVALAGGVCLHSRPLAGLLRGCGQIAASVVTIGEGLELRVSRLHEEGDEAASAVLDAIGSAAVEALQRRLGKHLCGRFEPRGLHVTRHYSPGYTGWDLRAQRLLFELFAGGGQGLPVRLSAYEMMRPRKSLSAVWGLAALELGAEQAIDRLPCRSCNLKRCSFRRVPQAPICLEPMSAQAVSLEAAIQEGWDKPAQQEDQSEAEEETMASEQQELGQQGEASREPAAGRLRAIEYPISVKALVKWAQNNLSCRREPDGASHYTFRFLGSTCSNGGVPISATMHAVVREAACGVVVEGAWIEIPEDDRGLRFMCEYGVRGAAFVRELGQPADFCGRTLEEAIAGLEVISPAGCFCKPPQVAHKWRQVLCTIHYALSQAASVAG